MKLVRFGERGNEKPGVLLDDGTRVDVSASGMDYDEEFFGGEGVERLRRWGAMNTGDLPRVESAVRLGAAISRPSNIVCSGLNYKDHAAEPQQPGPKPPALFFTAT